MGDPTVEAEHIATYDDPDFNHVGVVEMNRFQCTGNPVHTWDHPSKNYWLRQSAWGSFWRERRDRWRGLDGL